MDSKHLLAIVTLWLTVSYFLVHRAEGFIYRRMRRNEKGRQQRKGSRSNYSSVKKMVSFVSNSWVCNAYLKIKSEIASVNNVGEVTNTFNVEC